MSHSRESKPLLTNLAQPTKTNKSPNDMVMARIFAQSAARKGWSVRHRLMFSLILGGLAAVLGVVALAWTLFSPNGNVRKGTSSDETRHLPSERKVVDKAISPAGTGPLHGTQSAYTNPVAAGRDQRPQVSFDTARFDIAINQQFEQVLARPAIRKGIDDFVRAIASDPSAQPRCQRLWGTLAADPTIGESRSSLVKKISAIARDSETCH